MNILCDYIRREREYGQIISNVTDTSARRRKPAMVTGLCEGALYAFLAAFVSDTKRETSSPALIIARSEKQARAISEALSALGVTAPVFPSREPVLYNIVSSHETEHERIAVLSSLLKLVPDAVVATPDAALQYTVPKEKVAEMSQSFAVGDSVGLEAFISTLTGAGYTRCDPVEGKGQFSVRGGIVDVFLPTGDMPLRIEFFGDEIDQIAVFDVMTQRKTENISGFTLSCARELLIGRERREKLADLIKARAQKLGAEARASLLREYEVLTGEADIPFADKYISFIYPEGTVLLDYFPDNAAVAAVETQSIAERLDAVEKHTLETTADLIENGLLIPKYCDFSCPSEALYAFFDDHAALLVNTFASQYRTPVGNIYSFETRGTPSVNGNFEELKNETATLIKAKYTVVLFGENEVESGNTAGMLNEAGLNCSHINNYFSIKELTPGIPAVTCMNFCGFELVKQKFICIPLFDVNPDKRISVYRRSAAKKKKTAEKIISYADLVPGDYVVHAAHGIGRYVGLENIRNYDGVRRDHIKIAYSGTDVLYVPCDQIELVSKYIGAHSDDDTLKLSKLGGSEWSRTKSKVKSEVKSMAKELISLYARRQRTPGFACAADDEMQREFESTFEYEETDGQLEAARDIKDDMEKPVPMDRLLCGDVGFGKTEVALRAAFKAVENNKQVAILVPTTILAMQHYRTISSRMRAFPIKVSLLSRFRTQKEQEATVRALRRGDTDIVVGTHRLLSGDIAFRDLGLAIIDEEQRFGVAHKEKLKQLAPTVDVLTLTATPIPRTLNMAMSSIRDMSVLDEAPGDRVPVQTFVLEHDDIVINEAIRRELARGGQVFYLHNRIESLYSKAAALRKKFPDAAIEVAHGQMEREQLSDIWQSLVAGETDILVCTTIIETGVDVPNANTLIIENADRMGLSQLHQIRGRVGRSARKAFAYFTYPSGRALSEISSKRLQAIKDFTQFGAGFKIALRDLEIRGAGDVLGARQHGHIESVGYDLYIKLLNEAVLEEKGVKPKEKAECAVNIGRDAFIPEQYVPSASQRIDMYKKIASIENESDADDIADEFLDRFGDLPPSVGTLISASLVRALGAECGFSRIDETSSGAMIYLRVTDIRAISVLASEFPGKFTFVPSENPYLNCKKPKKEPIFTFILDLLKKYIQIREKKE